MDTTAILTMVSTASTLINTVADLTTDKKVREKTVAANNALIEIQSGLLAMQKESLELQQENEKLKRKIEQYNNWEETKRYYTLIKLHSGNFVYESNDLHPIKEPTRRICPNCYNDRIDMILQYAGGKGVCPKCKTAYFNG